MPLHVETFTLAEPYEAVYQRMLALVEARLADDTMPDIVMLGQHPPTLTCGRKTDPQHILIPAGQLPLVWIERGGDVTWHGPGQLVIYPILKLKNRDLHAYLRQLEQFIIELLAMWGVQAMRHIEPEKNTTGVWVATPSGPKKIASIGVAVKRWVTYHGVAINISNDLAAYQAIYPCGFPAETMTRLVDVLYPATVSPL